MKLYIKEKVFSFRDRFNLYDEFENEVFFVEGELLTIGKKLHLYRSGIGTEEAYIHEEVLSLLPRYYISRNNVDIAKVVKEFTFFHQEYTVEGPGWTVKGDFFDHEYEIKSGNRVIASISRHWFTWGDTYEIDITDPEDEILAICVVLVIDSVISKNAAAAAAVTD